MGVHGARVALHQLQLFLIAPRAVVAHDQQRVAALVAGLRPVEQCGIRPPRHQQALHLGTPFRCAGQHGHPSAQQRLHGRWLQRLYLHRQQQGDAAANPFRAFHRHLAAHGLRALLAQRQAKLGVEWDVPVLEGLTLTGNATAMSQQYISADNRLSVPGP
ncbi:hypothetical protein G6F63_014533 [Rhizopus arrhizus]|nr:hypothetical protein G6F63_014533 [Rhizopus arrhizus]